MPSTFWTNHKLSYGPEGLLVVPRIVTSPPRAVVIRSAALAARLARRPHGDERSRIVMPIGGVVLYVWKPDSDRIWPQLAANMPKPEPEIDKRRKPGPRPKKNWKLFAAAELYRIVETEHKPPPTAASLAQRCMNKLNYHPDISEVQKLLREFL